MNHYYSSLLETAGGDSELVGELVTIFKEEAPKMVGCMENAIKDNSPDKLKTTAHTLKSSLSSMGADDACDLAIALETMGVNEELGEADLAMQKLKIMIDKILSEL